MIIDDGYHEDGEEDGDKDYADDADDDADDDDDDDNGEPLHPWSGKFPHWRDWHQIPRDSRNSPLG